MNENCDNDETRNRTKYDYDAFGNKVNATGTVSVVFWPSVLVRHVG